MKRHPIDPLSFVFGAFFLVTGLIFAFGGDASKLHVAWFWPVVLGVTGLGLMLVTIRSVRPEPTTVPSVGSGSGAEAGPAEPIVIDGSSDEPGPFEDDPDEPAAAEPGGLDRGSPSASDG
jgi:hypothetical protein